MAILQFFVDSPVWNTKLTQQNAANIKITANVKPMVAAPTVKKTEEKPKLVRLNIEAIPNEKLLYPIRHDNIEIGDVIYLQPMSCDDIEFDPIKFKLHGIVKKYKNFDLNAYVVKHVDKTDSTIFALNRLQCKDLDIAYQENLQLLSMDLDWKKYIEKVDFNPNDMSTYPNENGKLNKLLVKVSGLPKYDNAIQINKTILNRNLFVKALNDTRQLSYEIVTNKIDTPINDALTLNNEFYIIIDASKLNLTIENTKDKKITDLVDLYFYNKIKYGDMDRGFSRDVSNDGMHATLNLDEFIKHINQGVSIDDMRTSLNSPFYWQKVKAY